MVPTRPKDDNNRHARPIIYNNTTVYILRPSNHVSGAANKLLATNACRFTLTAGLL